MFFHCCRCCLSQAVQIRFLSMYRPLPLISLQGKQVLRLPSRFRLLPLHLRQTLSLVVLLRCQLQVLKRRLLLSTQDFRLPSPLVPVLLPVHRMCILFFRFLALPLYLLWSQLRGMNLIPEEEGVLLTHLSCC